MTLPFDGAISAFHAAAPLPVREAIAGKRKGHVITPGYPYEERMDRDDYEDTLRALQRQLVRLQSDVKASGKRVVVIFEGRDAAGKGGAIKRFRENMNPRVAQVVALSKPTDRERGEWYFQRYVKALPAAGEIVLFDRSWYNRAVVEHVFSFCDADERAVVALEFSIYMSHIFVQFIVLIFC